MTDSNMNKPDDKLELKQSEIISGLEAGLKNSNVRMVDFQNNVAEESSEKGPFIISSAFLEVTGFKYLVVVYKPYKEKKAPSAKDLTLDTINLQIELIKQRFNGKTDSGTFIIVDLSEAKQDVAKGAEVEAAFTELFGLIIKEFIIANPYQLDSFKLVVKANKQLALVDSITDATTQIVDYMHKATQG